jgi:predicted nucleic acid-binding protein
MDGGFELIVSPLLLAELERALAYPMLRKRIAAEDAAQVVERLRRSATELEDPASPPPLRSPDPGEDYLLVLAATARAALVTGDGHLLSLDTALPIYAPAEFVRTMAP